MTHSPGIRVRYPELENDSKAPMEEILEDISPDFHSLKNQLMGFYNHHKKANKLNIRNNRVLCKH